MLSQADKQITKFSTPNLEIPVLNTIRDTYKGGSCCVLTASNEEALRMTGTLNRNGFRACLIQSNDGFNLYNLFEIRSFIQMLGDGNRFPVITRDRWEASISAFLKRFSRSASLPVCLNLFAAFDSVNPKKYLSDFIEFVRESAYEDFISGGDNLIYVSTIHKAKGREFDSVYTLLDRYSLAEDMHRRALYVGMTRAKKSLYISCNTGILDEFASRGVVFKKDGAVYPESDEILLQFGHRDVFLGFFKDITRLVSGLYSGCELVPEGDFFLAVNGKRKNRVLKLSKAGSSAVKALTEKGFKLYRAEVRFIVYWKGTDSEDGEECLVVLPDLYFRKEKNEAGNLLS